MANISLIISSFLLIMKTNSGILARIEFMVILNSILLLILFIFDTYRRRSRSQLLKYILLAIDAASLSMVLHTIGLMQSAQISNNFFEVWAILLVALRFSINYVTVYGLQEQVRVQWNREFGAALTSYAWAGKLNGTRGLHYKKPLWALWALQPLRIGYMFLAFMQARKSYWQGRSSDLVADYMETENESKDHNTNTKKNESSENSEPKGSNPDACDEVGPSSDCRLSNQSNKPSHTGEDSEPETNQMVMKEGGAVNLRNNSQRETEIVEVEQKTGYEEPSNSNPNTEPHQHIDEDNVRTNVEDKGNSGAYDPSTMRGYLYLIKGEIWQELEYWGFDGRLQLWITNKKKLITLDKIWECKGKLLGEWGDKDGQLKDLCLSFALYRLLRCRFDEHPLPDISITKTRMLLVDGILSGTSNCESVEHGNKRTKDNENDKDKGNDGTEEYQDSTTEESGGHKKQASDNDQRCTKTQLSFYSWCFARCIRQPLCKCFNILLKLLVGDGAVKDKLDEAADRVFEITGSELSFLNDYMYSRFPIVFWRGGGIIISIFIYIVTLATTIWVAISLVLVYTTPEGDFTHEIHGYNVDLLITWGMLIFIAIKETWEILIYLLSDWTKVVLISTYVECVCMRNRLMENLIWLLCKCSMVGRWHGKIDQYNFLEAYDYRPTACNLAYYLSLGSVPKDTDGVQTKTQIVLPNEVKKAIVRSMSSLIKELKMRRLPGGLPFILHRNNVSGSISEMFQLHKLHTCSHIILVLHIATSLCEIELCQQYNVYLADSDFPSIWSFLNCCSSEPFLVKQERLGKDLRNNFIVANSLSQYCAHLLIKRPDLLPDHIFIPEEVFQHTVCDARDVLEGCDSLQTIYKRVMKEGEKEIKSKNEETIMRLSAKLGYLLIQTLDEEARWKALAGLWADLLVYMAPNSNVEAHKNCLATGGEFITHVWILLYHAGILKNSLLDQEVKNDIENPE